ncbi:MAG: lysozyme [Bacteroidales bacterium]
METSKKGIDLIKSFECFRAKAYLCPAGVLTIGYGHTANVKSSQIVTQQQAEDLLRIDLIDTEQAVCNLVKSQLTQNQFDALASFVFNCGYGNFQKSTLLKRVNANTKDFVGIREAFMMWNKAKGNILPGLTRRRKEEADLYEK